MAGRLAVLTDAELFARCEDAITKAAYGNPDAAEQIDRLMREAKARHRAAGHSGFCDDDIYQRALATAQAKQTFADLHLPTCDCEGVK